MATSRSWTGRDGERREETLFIDVTVWDRQAETCCQYLRKGSSIHVEGSLRMDTWDDKTTGEKRSKIRVQADRVQFLDAVAAKPAMTAVPADDAAYSGTGRDTSSAAHGFVRVLPTLAGRGTARLLAGLRLPPTRIGSPARPAQSRQSSGHGGIATRTTFRSDPPCFAPAC